MTTKHAYPRPQLVRTDWTNLNGAWDFAIDAEAEWTRPDQVGWNATIEVPYTPETPASGIGDTGFYRACWYRRAIEVPASEAGARQILHFGAVDYQCHGLGRRACRGAARGRLCPVQGRYHRLPERSDLTDDHRARRGRSARPGEAARQAGLATRAALASGIRARPASGRPSGWKRVPAVVDRLAALDAERGALGDRPGSPPCDGQRLRRVCGCGSELQ